MLPIKDDSAPPHRRNSTHRLGPDHASAAPIHKLDHVAPAEGLGGGLQKKPAGGGRCGIVRAFIRITAEGITNLGNVNKVVGEE